MNKTSVKFCILQGLYWACVCTNTGYASVYLISKGYTNSKIGIIMAFSSLMAVIIQPLIASAADKSRKITIRLVITILGLLMVGNGLTIFFVGANSLPLTISYSAAIIFATALQSFTNAFPSELETEETKINFGVCRAMGSVSYAIVSSIMGYAVAAFTESVIPLAFTLISTCLVIVTFTLKPVSGKQGVSNSIETESDSTGAKSLPDFLRSNKRFVLFLTGTVFFFYMHIVITHYLFQIVSNIGGNSANMGLCSGISAGFELPTMILFSKLIKKISCKKLIRISLVIYLLKFILMATVKSIPLLYIAEALQMGSYAIFVPASVYYVNALFPKEDVIKGQSMITTSMAIGQVLANLIGAPLMDKIGVTPSLYVGVAIAFVGILISFFSVEDVK